MQVTPDVLILAGGLGTRLREVVPNRQKVVAEVNGEPFIIHTLRKLYLFGIKKVIFALGYYADDAIKLIEPLVPKGIEVLYSVEKNQLGTGGALRNAVSYIQTKEVLVINGDSIIEYNLNEFIKFHQNKNARISILLCEVPDISRYGLVEMDLNNEIIKFTEKKMHISINPGLINSGVYLINKFEIINFSEKPHSLEKDVFPNLCGKGLFGMVTQAKFLDIGIPEDFVKASNFLKFYK
jgi:D-glycero-alpha-D-manno-heptose 1-phosphate guanylyltransferase